MKYKYSHVCAISESQHKFPEGIKSKLKDSFYVSPKNPYTQRHFRSKTSIQYEINRQKRLGLTYVIHPYSAFRMRWEYGMFVIFFIQQIVHPTSGIFDWTYLAVLIFLTLMDLIGWVDILVHCFTGFKDPYTYEIILQPKRIWKNYFTGQFVVDVVASLPTQLVNLQLLMFLKIIRIYKFTTFFTTILKIHKVSNRLAWLAKHIIICLLIIHWMTCVTYAIPNYLARDEYSWIKQANLQEANDAVKYINSLFRAVCHLLCVDHGIYSAVIYPDIIVGGFMFVFGKIYFAFLFVLLLQFLLNYEANELEYDYEISQLHGYMKMKQIPKKVQDKVFQYYDYRYYKAYYKENAIMSTLSERLKRELLFFGSKKLLAKIPMFQDLPKAVISKIMTKLELEVYMPKDVIIEAGTSGDSMYLLTMGTVSVYAGGVEVAHLEDGDYFGEIALLKVDSTRVATVVALEITEVYKLKRSEFLQCFAHNEHLYYKILELAFARGLTKSDSS